MTILRETVVQQPAVLGGGVRKEYVRVAAKIFETLGFINLSSFPTFGGSPKIKSPYLPYIFLFFFGGGGAEGRNFFKTSPARVLFFGTQTCRVSLSSTCIPFNFPANGTHFRTINYHGAHNLNLIYYFLFFMLCLGPNSEGKPYVTIYQQDSQFALHNWLRPYKTNFKFKSSLNNPTPLSEGSEFRVRFNTLKSIPSNLFQLITEMKKPLKTTTLH